MVLRIQEVKSTRPCENRKNEKTRIPFTLFRFVIKPPTLSATLILLLTFTKLKNFGKVGQGD